MRPVAARQKIILLMLFQRVEISLFLITRYELLIWFIIRAIYINIFFPNYVKYNVDQF